MTGKSGHYCSDAGKNREWLTAGKKLLKMRNIQVEMVGFTESERKKGGIKHDRATRWRMAPFTEMPES